MVLNALTDTIIYIAKVPWYRGSKINELQGSGNESCSIEPEFRVLKASSTCRLCRPFGPFEDIPDRYFFF